MNMVHKMIKKVTEEYIVPKDQKDVEEILGKKVKAEEVKEDDDTFKEDYEEGMDEFMDSLGGSHKELEPKNIKRSEIRALG